jgi:hypothetical protein
LSVKIVATNFYGSSTDSLINSSEYLRTVPTAPVIAENTLLRTATTVQIVWSTPYDGGIPIVDYRFNSDQAMNNYIVLKANILETFLLVEGLTTGSTYKFTVEARNSYGYSLASNELTILVAYLPG